MKTFLIWLLAVTITLSSAIYQRITGPTHPISGSVNFNNQEICYHFYRSHGGTSDQTVAIPVSDTSFTGILFWKRYKTGDSWRKVKMHRRNDSLVASLPNQPPAGKLEYFVKISDNKNSITLPQKHTMVIRFKGAVPTPILIIHIIFMFTAMLLSVRTGLEFFRKEPKLYKLTYWTLATLTIGGLIFGPLVQQYAFGALWTGFPFGHDLTDNKTLIIFVGWLIALLMYKRAKHPARWAFAASLLMMLIYLIPHSALGSELDYNKLDKEKAKQEKLINKNENTINDTTKTEDNKK